MEASVSEIHGYPLRPEGYSEPLFRDVVSRREVAEHLLGASWLSRASELSEGCGESAHVRREGVTLGRRCGGVEVRRRGSTRRLRVVEVLRRWREVGGWWEAGCGVDRVVVRVLLSDGSVVDLARERGGARDPGIWTLIGVED